MRSSLIPASEELRSWRAIRNARIGGEHGRHLYGCAAGLPGLLRAGEICLGTASNPSQENKSIRVQHDYVVAKTDAPEPCRTNVGVRALLTLSSVRDSSYQPRSMRNSQVHLSQNWTILARRLDGLLKLRGFATPGLGGYFQVNGVNPPLFS